MCIFANTAISSTLNRHPLNTFAEIILPVPIPQLFTYSVPKELVEQITVGSRVVVEFGKKKQYSGIVYHVHHKAPENYETKPILSVIDSRPAINPRQLSFWSWIAEYYICSLGEVYKAALPSGLKLESESRLLYNSEFETETPLTKKEQALLDWLCTRKTCTIQDLQQSFPQFNCLPPLRLLVDKGAIFLNEELRQGYKPKTEKLLLLHPQMRNEPALQACFTNLEKAPKQLEALIYFLSKVGGLGKAFDSRTIEYTPMVNDTSASAVKELIQKHILTLHTQTVSRIALSPHEVQPAASLSVAQRDAIGQIRESFQHKPVTLLQGVTSSGKTEIYIHLIQEYLDKGLQVLYLLPEIALTTQITNRLRRHFGNRLGIYHSKFNDSERVEVWNNLLQQKSYDLILGVRSSILLPFSQLGLIIVDEEHEASYKQYDPAPRYHARDSAIILGMQHGAKVLLGTATPSVESYFNATQGKYGLVTLQTRFEGIQLPAIVPVNTKEARRKKQMKSMFSPQLVESVQNALHNGEQVILFQNRRGFSPFVECNRCAWIPKCVNCDVSLTYHKNQNQLVCHYCAHSMPLPHVCGACGSPSLDTIGFGTEKVEEEIQLLFPETKVARMDLDTARSRKSYELLIGQFEARQIQILIGTQMISKGLDFDNVSLVGILNADSMLNYPDFRAFERSFQLMSQVSGRAGRKHKQGLVILQTSDPNHPVIQDVIHQRIVSHMESQLSERLQFKYPPFFRLIQISVKHKNTHTARQAAVALGNLLRTLLGDRVLGPQEPAIQRIATYFIQRILLKIERNGSPAKVKELLLDSVHRISAQPDFRQVIIQIDVDPYN